MSNKSIQQDLLNGLKEIYKDAEAKKIDKDNFLDIFIPSINPAKGTHLFFNTSKGVIKIGYYVRDEKFINAIVDKASSSIEAASNGLRVLGNPEFKNVKDALIAAQKFLSAFSSSNVKTGKVAKPDSTLKKPLVKTKTSEETKKATKKDIIDEFNNAIKAFKDLKMDAVAEYVQAGNPVLQFSNDNGVIDNFLISMTSGGNLNKEKLDLYIKKGLDLNATTSDADAYTACHFAAWDGNDVVLKMLVDAGANPDIIGGDTMTALNLAAANGHMECVEILVSSGVNIDNRITNDNTYHSTKGGTALRDAVINTFWDVADFLIRSGASVDILNEKCANGEDFFSAVRKIFSELDNKDYHLTKLDELEKKCSKSIKKTKTAKTTELAPYVKDEKYASISLAVLLEIGFDLAGECKVVPASLYDKDILEERFNGIRGIPTTVIICAGFFEDDILTTEDLKINFPKIVNEVRQWYINLAVSDIDNLIPSIKASIQTIANEWDDYMSIHGKLLCGYIKELANAKGLESDNGKMMVQLVLDGLEISEEDWESNEEEEEEEDVEEEEEEDDEEFVDSYHEQFYCDNVWIREDYVFDIKPFCNIFENDSEIDLLFRKFTKVEIDLIVNKVRETKSYLIFPFVSEMLKRKMNITIKPPFWFIPFVGYGNNSGSLMYFGQDGIYNCYNSPIELTNTCHVDFWQNISVESGYNGLFDEDTDDNSISTLKINWSNPKTGKNGNISIVEFHGEEYGSTLKIVKAIWDNAWQEVVDRSRDSSQYLLGPPPNIESFDSWDDLLIWASDTDSNVKKAAKKAVPKVKANVKEEEDEDIEEEVEEEEDVDQTDSDILNFESNADKFYRKELNRFLQIAKRTGILTNDIVSEPTIQERDELWDITRVFLDRIYIIDNETYPNEYEVNLLCFYSIVALHWCDIYVTDKRFSFENGRFRRDTIALVLCLSTRVSYTFENYDLMHNGFVMPHMYFSALLWTIRTIIAKKEDVYFNKYTVADAEKALQLFMSIDKKNQQKGSSGFIEMKQVPEGHPLLNIWLDLIKLYINERPPFSFILKYISNDTNHSKLGILKGLFGGNKSNAGEYVTLIPKDIESNNSFLNKRIETISFEDAWPFMNDLMFTAHHMILLRNKTMPKEALNVILTKSSEWVADLDLKDVQKKYKEVVKEYEKNHSDIRVKFVLGKMYKYMTLQNQNDIDERNTQLRLVIGDLVEIAKSDQQYSDYHFEFITAINNYWGGVLASDNNSNTNGDEDVEEEYPEQGLPVIDCTANEAKVINPFLRVSINYNEIDNIEVRLPKLIKSLLASAVLTPDQIDILSEQIKKNKAIPVLKYAPKECFNYVKSVWWLIPLVIWKEDVLSSIVVDKNGLYSIASSDTTELSLISPFDRVTEYTLDKLEPSIERLTLIFDNGAFQTFDCFVDDSQSTYLSIIAAILDVRMETINKSKKSAGWKEGAGGEGFIEFDNVTQLYDLKYWKKKEISRPDPRFFG